MRYRNTEKGKFIGPRLSYRFTSWKKGMRADRAQGARHPKLPTRKARVSMHTPQNNGAGGFVAGHSGLPCSEPA